LDPSVSHDYDTVLAGQEPHSIEQLEKARNWAKRVDVQIQKEQLGHAFINGKHYPLDGVRVFYSPGFEHGFLCFFDLQNFLAQLQQTAGTQTAYLQGEVQAGRLRNTPELDMSVYFYDLPATPKRRNRYLFPDETTPLRVYRLDSLFTGAGFEYPYKDLIYPGKDLFMSREFYSICPFQLSLVKHLYP
jgi:UDP-glucose:glycoprotein glucosyltransferase